MPVTRRPYRPDDFLRVRDFLSETYPSFDQTPNWRIEHWEWGRYHVIPMFGNYGKDQHLAEDALRAIVAWEGQNTIWETDTGVIVGLVTTETPWPGGAFLQRRPGFDSRLPAMLDHAEAGLRDPGKLVSERGYARDEESVDHDTVFEVAPGLPAAGLPAPGLPPGYTIRSMADDHDIEARREIIGRMFGHTDPREWPSAFAQEELRKAPSSNPSAPTPTTGARAWAGRS